MAGPVYQFGDFRLDCGSFELLRKSSVLRMERKPIELLILLVSRQGQLVTRAEIVQHLWSSEVFVDTEHGINTAIRKIRYALGDDPDNPRFVQTLPSRGYRFIGELECPNQAVVPVEPIRESSSRRMWLKIAAGVLAILVSSVGAGVAYRWFWHGGPPEKASEKTHLNALPFTALPGQEIEPAISPDGSRIAFAWNNDAGTFQKGFDLYVKAIGSETLLRLTHHPSNWIGSVWSPDGTQIAFHRLAGDDTGIYVLPALGGPERKLVSTRVRSNARTFISWSPDGKWIAYSDFLPGEDDVEHIRNALLSIETLETTWLPIPPNCVNTGAPAFSHSGDSLAYLCKRSMDEFGLYSMPFPSGQGRLISEVRGFPNGFTWSADDTRLIYANEGKLGEVTVASGTFRWLEIAAYALTPTVSSRGDKLAYSSLFTSVGIWRSDLSHPEFPPVELVPSTRSQFDAQYSPDGKQIAFASLRSGVQGVWVSGEDGANLVQISKPNIRSGSPQWSPDGKRIAFDAQDSGRSEIYVADVSKGIPQKLTTNISDVSRPHWSRDGKWIYFQSDEPGRIEAFRCPAQGGDAVALSKDTAGVEPQESFDGGTIYFASGSNKPVLKRVGQQTLPGMASGVDGLPRVLSETAWSPAAGGIYFVPADSPRSVRFFDSATKRIRSVFEVDKDFDSGLSVSPDDRRILYGQIGNANSDIMLVDHFH